MAMIPAILGLGSSIGLDVAAGRPMDSIACYRLFALFGISLIGGLIFIIFVEYAVQLAGKRRRHIPIDRIGLLLSYFGFMSMVFAETYDRFRQHLPLSHRTTVATVCIIIGLVSLTRKAYRVHMLIDEDKMIEDHKPI